MAERQPPPFADRIDAGQAFTGHLLSILVGAPVELASRVAGAWFDAVRDHCGRGLVVVFGDFVVGRPDPLLLEVAHHANHVRAAEDGAAGGSGWVAADDLHHLMESPRLFERVIAALAGGQDVERVVGWSAIDAALACALDRQRDPIGVVVDVMIALERMVAVSARAIRIGDAAVISVRPDDRTTSWRAAA